jgi:hypothetical protein
MSEARPRVQSSPITHSIAWTVAQISGVEPSKLPAKAAGAPAMTATASVMPNDARILSLLVT